MKIGDIVKNIIPYKIYGKEYSTGTEFQVAALPVVRDGKFLETKDGVYFFAWGSTFAPAG